MGGGYRAYRADKRIKWGVRENTLSKKSIKAYQKEDTGVLSATSVSLHSCQCPQCEMYVGPRSYSSNTISRSGTKDMYCGGLLGSQRVSKQLVPRSVRLSNSCSKVVSKSISQPGRCQYGEELSRVVSAWGDASGEINYPPQLWSRKRTWHVYVLLLWYRISPFPTAMLKGILLQAPRTTLQHW